MIFTYWESDWGTMLFAWRADEDDGEQIFWGDHYHNTGDSWSYQIDIYVGF